MLECKNVIQREKMKENVENVELGILKEIRDFMQLHNTIAPLRDEVTYYCLFTKR